MSETNDQLVAEYVALLPMQYADPQNTPNAVATINLLATVAIASQIVGQVLNGFALATAQGVQLDILGQFVGAKRVLPNYSPTITYFGMQDTTGIYDPSAGGYGSVNSPTPPSDYWLSTSAAEGSYTLSDAEMLALIRYLAAVNNTGMSVADIDNILYDSFADYVQLVDNEDMSVDYVHEAGDPGTLYGIVKFLNALPHPAGVEVAAG